MKVATGPPRPRGRPRAVVDGQTAANKEGGANGGADGGHAPAAAGTAAGAGVDGEVTRKRGRPPKKVEDGDAAGKEGKSDGPTEKRGRGRPPSAKPVVSAAPPQPEPQLTTSS